MTSFLALSLAGISTPAGAQTTVPLVYLGRCPIEDLAECLALGYQSTNGAEQQGADDVIPNPNEIHIVSWRVDGKRTWMLPNTENAPLELLDEDSLVDWSEEGEYRPFSLIYGELGTHNWFAADLNGDGFTDYAAHVFGADEMLAEQGIEIEHGTAAWVAAMGPVWGQAYKRVMRPEEASEVYLMPLNDDGSVQTVLREPEETYPIEFWEEEH